MSVIEFKTSKKALFIDREQITQHEWDDYFVNEKQNKVILRTNHKFAVYDLNTKEIVFNMSGLDQVQVHDSERIMVGKGNKDALYSIDGTVLINFFDGCIFWEDNFYVLKMNEKYGIASNDGKTKIDIIFDDIACESSHIIVTLNKKKGLYNLKCEKVLDAEYDQIGIFDKYIITVPDKDDICRRQIYTIDGKKLIVDCDNVFCISDNYVGILVEITSNRRYSLYSFDGTPILEGYSHMEFGDEIADRAIIAAKNGKAGVFDLDGSEILPCKYKRISYGAGSSYEAQLVTVIENHDKRAIYSTKERKFVLPFGKYKSIKSYKKGICDLVLENNVHGYYITKADRFIEAEDVNITKSGRYEFKINDKWEMFEM